MINPQEEALSNTIAKVEKDKMTMKQLLSSKDEELSKERSKWESECEKIRVECEELRDSKAGSASEGVNNDAIIDQLQSNLQKTKEELENQQALVRNLEVYKCPLSSPLHTKLPTCARGHWSFSHSFVHRHFSATPPLICLSLFICALPVRPSIAFFFSDADYIFPLCILPLSSQDETTQHQEETERLKSQVKEGNEYVKKQRAGLFYTCMHAARAHYTHCFSMHTHSLQQNNSLVPFQCL
jgi:hypothetical protein